MMYRFATCILLLAGAIAPAQEKVVRTDRYGDPLPEGAVARLGTVRLRQGGTVWFGAWSPDGRHIATASDDDTVRLWDARTGKPLRRLPADQFGVRAVAFSPDGKVLTSGGEDNTILLWDAAAAAPLRVFKGHRGVVECLTFSPDGKLLALTSCETIILWDPAMGRELRRMTTPERELQSLAFSPDSRLLAAGGLGRSIRLWDVAGGREVRRLNGHEGCVGSLAFSRDGRTLAWISTVASWPNKSGSRQASSAAFVRINAPPPVFPSMN